MPEAEAEPVATEEELSKAALQIQSVHRGKAARAEVEERKATMSAAAEASVPEPEPEAEAEAEAEATEEELSKAALQIQSVHRGKAARAEVEERKAAAAVPEAVAEAEASGELQPAAAVVLESAQEPEPTEEQATEEPAETLRAAGSTIVAAEMAMEVAPVLVVKVPEDSEKVAQTEIKEQCVASESVIEPEPEPVAPSEPEPETEPEPAPAMNTMKFIRQTFDHIDVDGDGMINERELDESHIHGVLSTVSLDVVCATRSNPVLKCCVCTGCSDLRCVRELEGGTDHHKVRQTQNRCHQKAKEPCWICSVNEEALG